MTSFQNRLILATFSTAALLTAGATLADSPATNHQPRMPAVVTDKAPEATEPAAGRNSFTEKQATERLMTKGYSKVSQLSVDKDGVWRGTAMMKAAKQRVAVDYQGNVTAE